MRNPINAWCVSHSTVVLLFFCVFISCRNEQTSLHIPYPTAPPIDSIFSFLPGIVSSENDSIEFNAAFSPDGKSFYFSRSQNRKWDIYVSHYDGEQWTTPIKAGFNSSIYSLADPAFGPDGTLYFISDFPRDEADTIRDFDIWFVKPMDDGTWSTATNLKEVNTDSTEYYISFAGDGNLYFASSRPGGYGLEDIYVSRLVNGKYSAPENLGSPINSSYSDHDPCLLKNESFIIYTSVGRADGFGEGDLYYSIKDEKGIWSQGVNMGDRINTSSYEYCSYLTPDMNYFFYSSMFDVKWMRVESLPKELVSIIKLAREGNEK